MVLALIGLFGPRLFGIADSLLRGDLYAQEKNAGVSSLSIKVVGMSFFGPRYGKLAVFQYDTPGYRLKYSCSGGQRCACSSVAKEIDDAEVDKVVKFISTFKDQGKKAKCCDHPWTEIDLNYFSKASRKIILSYDLLRLEEIFNFCGTPFVRFDPKNSESQVRLGKQFYQIGLYERAKDALERAIALNAQHGDVAAYEALGESYRMLRNYEKALEAYHRVVSLQPNDAKTFLKLGALHSDFGRPHDAIETYKGALDLRPDQDTEREAYANLGHLYEQVGRFGDAKDAFKEALRIKPDNDFTRYSLGKVYLALKDMERALEQYDELKRRKSNYAEDLRGMISQKKHEASPKPQ